MNWVQLLFSPHGRIDRDNFWRAFFVIAVLWVFLLVATPIIVPAATTGIYCAEFAVVSCWFLMLARKRLHDRSRSGYWLLIMYGVPAVVFVGLVTLLEQQSTLLRDYPYAMMIVSYTILGPIGLWAFAELFYLRGTSGANHYGADPLDPAA
jgi:uncharacterized membrane protein YhaH (DUF805 family)